MPPKILVPLGKITRQNENNPRFVELMESTLSITHVLFYSTLSVRLSPVTERKIY